MKYGYCMGVNFLRDDAMARATFDAVAEAGFDYVELPLSALWAMQPGEMAKLNEALGTIPCRACNIFFPSGLTIVGPKRDMGEVNAYLGKMIPLAAGLGVETLVFGSGGARKIPDGVSREAVWDNLREVVKAMDAHAKMAGIKISVEPLNLSETDMINSYGQAVELTGGLRHVSTMIDSYHVATDGQNYDDVYKQPEALWHLHTAYPVGRMVPSPEDDISYYADFVQMVKTVGYDGKISVEGALRAEAPLDIGAEVRACLGVLKGMFE
ncbi:MAG: sugar phosphate isomerase/epimerase [Defluviitaleaceae bacterium]|nr:sugar phosphate isomerase/epimerase [Defluviitaleaceae bacterium]